MAILIDREMYSAKGSATNFLLDYVLIDTMLGGTIVLTCDVLGMGVQ